MASSEAPWMSTFRSHIDAVQLADEDVQLSLATSTLQGHLPRVRHVGHAGFWSVHVPTNATFYRSPCPAFVTDSRSNKVADIFGQIDQPPENFDKYGLGAGGGGPVEAAYWLKAVKMQWRVRGRCFFVVDRAAAADRPSGKSSADQDRSSFNRGLSVTKAAVMPYLVRVVKNWALQDAYANYADLDDDAIWEAEVEGYYQQLSTDVQISFQRSSFTVGIIVPDEVEMMDLTDATVARRRIWKCFYDENGQPMWKIVWDNI